MIFYHAIRHWLLTKLGTFKAQGQDSPECSCCEQLRLDLAYERSEKEFYRLQWVNSQEQLTKQQQEKRSAKELIDPQHFGASRGHLTLSSMKAKAQGILDKKRKEEVGS